MPHDSPEEFFEEVLRIADTQGKIDAIKYYREETGADLGTAKGAVERLLEGAQPARVQATAAQAPSEIPRREEIVLALQRGRTIEAIRIYREATGRGLRDSRLAVEQLQQQLGIPRSGGEGRGFRILALILLSLTPAIIYFSC